MGARIEDERLTSLFGGSGGVWWPGRKGRVEPACDCEAEPWEKDMDMEADADADTGREASEGVVVPDRVGKADRRLAHEGRERSGSWGAAASSSATESIARSASKLLRTEAPVVMRRSRRRGGRSAAPERRIELLECMVRSEKGELAARGAGEVAVEWRVVASKEGRAEEEEVVVVVVVGGRMASKGGSEVPMA